MLSGLAASTARTYTSGQRGFLRFCASHGFVPLPASETTLLRYVANRVSLGLSASTISTNLAATRHLHIINSHANPMSSGFERLRLVLRALKKQPSLQGNACR